VIRLTARGREFRTVANVVLAELDARLAESLGAHDRDALVRALKGMVEL
jgi:hypothetical protein